MTRDTRHTQRDEVDTDDPGFITRTDLIFFIGGLILIYGAIALIILFTLHLIGAI